MLKKILIGLAILFVAMIGCGVVVGSPEDEKSRPVQPVESITPVPTISVAPVAPTTTEPQIVVPPQSQAPPQQVLPSAPVQPANPEVYYKNCSAAKAAGAAPVHAGDPGYRSALDRDGDGIGCE